MAQNQTTKHAPATPLTPVQKFYGTPTPVNAIELAIADHKAHCDPMQPMSEFVKALELARNRCNAYPKLVEALRQCWKLANPESYDGAEIVMLIDNVLAELGEAE